MFGNHGKFCIGGFFGGIVEFANIELTSVVLWGFVDGQLMWMGVLWVESLVCEGSGGHVSVEDIKDLTGAFMKDYIGTKQWPREGSIVKKSKNLSFYACKTYSYMT